MRAALEERAAQMRLRRQLTTPPHTDDKLRIIARLALTPPNKETAILRRACELYGVSIQELKDTQNRAIPVVRARWYAIRSIKKLRPHFSAKRIGRILGGMHHTSVWWALRHTDPALWEAESHEQDLSTPDLSGEWAI